MVPMMENRREFMRTLSSGGVRPSPKVRLALELMTFGDGNRRFISQQDAAAAIGITTRAIRKALTTKAGREYQQQLNDMARLRPIQPATADAAPAPNGDPLPSLSKQAARSRGGEENPAATPTVHPSPREFSSGKSVAGNFSNSEGVWEPSPSPAAGGAVGAPERVHPLTNMPVRNPDPWHPSINPHGTPQSLDGARLSLGQSFDSALPVIKPDPPEFDGLGNLMPTRCERNQLERRRLAEKRAQATRPLLGGRRNRRRWGA